MTSDIFVDDIHFRICFHFGKRAINVRKVFPLQFMFLLLYLYRKLLKHDFCVVTYFCISLFLTEFM